MRERPAGSVRRGVFTAEEAMKEALTIVMLVLLIVPLLVGVRRIRRLPRPRRKRIENDLSLSAVARTGPSLPSRPNSLSPPVMDVSDLRVAIFSGNYNYVRDGANQALNRLADYLLRRARRCASTRRR